MDMATCGRRAELKERREECSNERIWPLFRSIHILHAIFNSKNEMSMTSYSYLRIGFPSRC